MNKFISLFYVVALGATSAVHAAAPASDLSVTGDFTYASKYVFRGVELAGNSFQSSVELTKGPFNLGLWTNQPITSGQQNELDIYGGYKWTTGPLALEAVGTYYWYPEARGSLGQTDKTYELGLGATYDVTGFSPSVYYYYDFEMEAHTLQGAIGYKVPFDLLGSATIDTSVYIGAVDAANTAPAVAGPSIGDAYTYYGIDISIPKKLSDNATLTVGGHYVETLNLSGTGGPGRFRDRTNLWFTVGLTLGF